MPYLIDGHNLIPPLGLRLDSPDDEMELVAILQEFARRKRRKVEVYFDGAPPGHAGVRNLGSVIAHFVRLGSTADSAIRARLQALGRAAQNWTVVSSDREVRSAAHAAQAESIPSEKFAAFLRRTPTEGSDPVSVEPLSEKDIEEWIVLFSKRGGKGK